MKHLRYLKRHDIRFRLQVYKNAEFMEIKAQTIIFNAGDVTDYMYIILKGKVTVKSCMAQYSDIPTILNTLEDGDHFGELAMIDTQALNQDQDGKSPSG